MGKNKGFQIYDPPNRVSIPARARGYPRNFVKPKNLGENKCF